MTNKAQSPTTGSIAPLIVSFLCMLMLILIYGLPAAILFRAIQEVPGQWQVLSVLLAPFMYAMLFALTAGVLSLPFHKAIVKGKFPRDVRHPIYRGRRFYGTCWTALYYFKPVYFLVLTLPWLKWMTFRLFGYKGQMDFTVYPDTWIRDLPLLDFGKGVYIANRATLGTNAPLKNGRIVVDNIRVGEGSLIGHLAILATGAQIGNGSEVGTGSAIGFRVKIGNNSVVPSISWINHKANIGDNVRIGACCYIGLGAVVPDDTTVPPFSSIADRATAMPSQDHDALSPTES